MDASVLNTRRATEVSVFVVRAFVALRKSIAKYKEIMEQLSELEKQVTAHDKDISACSVSAKSGCMCPCLNGGKENIYLYNFMTVQLLLKVESCISIHRPWRFT